VIVTTSEGVSRRRVRRDLWAELRAVWNMSQRGFGELCGKKPGEKPLLEETWRHTGSNPRALSLLYQANWRGEVVVEELAESRELTREFVNKWREWLEVLVEDIDAASSPDYRFSVDSGSSPFIFTDSGSPPSTSQRSPRAPSTQQLCPRRRGLQSPAGLGNPESPVQLQASEAYELNSKF